MWINFFGAERRTLECALWSLRQLAKTIDKAEVSRLLEQTLEEEKATDMLLSNLAETLINQDAGTEVR